MISCDPFKGLMIWNDALITDKGESLKGPDDVLKDAWLENGSMVAWVSCLRPVSSAHDGSTQWVCGSMMTNFGARFEGSICIFTMIF